MGKITYDDKVTMNENADIPAVNKGRAADWNEIKNVVNENDDIVNGISQALPDIITTKDFTLTQTINANTEATYQFDNINLDGYQTLGIIAVDTNNGIDILKYSVFQNRAFTRLKNLGNSSQSVPCTIRVLYLKNL
jgi:hypothetical protein